MKKGDFWKIVRESRVNCIFHKFITMNKNIFNKLISI